MYRANRLHLDFALDEIYVEYDTMSRLCTRNWSVLFHIITPTSPVTLGINWDRLLRVTLVLVFDGWLSSNDAKKSLPLLYIRAHASNPSLYQRVCINSITWFTRWLLFLGLEWKSQSIFFRVFQGICYNVTFYSDSEALNRSMLNGENNLNWVSLVRNLAQTINYRRYCQGFDGKQTARFSNRQSEFCSLLDHCRYCIYRMGSLGSTSQIGRHEKLLGVCLKRSS